MKNFKKQLLIFVVSLFSAITVYAHPAQDLVESSTRDVMKALSEESERLKAEPEYLRKLVDEKLIPHLDFKSMTALSMGKHWRKATAEQREQLIAEFKQMLLNTYMSALTLYSGQEMKFKPFLAQKRDDRAIVRALFVQSGRKGIPVNYKLRKKDDSWKIYDIDVNSINLVSTYRTTFTQKIAQNGIDGLIEEMKKKNGNATKN